MMHLRFILLTAALFAASFSARAEAPFSAKLITEKHSVTISNDSYAPNAKDVKCRWVVYRDGERIAVGNYPLTAFRKGPLAPGDSTTVPLPSVVLLTAQHGGQVSLRLEFIHLVRDGDSAAEGKMLAVKQFDLTDPHLLASLSICNEVPDVETNDTSIVVKASGIKYAFSRKDGLLSSIRTGSLIGTEWLQHPVEFVRFKSPTHVDLAPACVSSNAVSFTTTLHKDANSLTCRWTVRGDGALICQAQAYNLGEAFRFDAGRKVRCHLHLAIEKPMAEYLGEGMPSKFAGIAEEPFLGLYPFDEGKVTNRLANVHSLALDAGWDHLSIASCRRPFSLRVVYPGYKPELLLTAHDLGFVIRPEKYQGVVGGVPNVHFKPETFLFGRRANGGLPHAQVYDLKDEKTITGLFVVGTVAGYEVETSTDGKRWTRVAQGRLPAGDLPHRIDFKAPVTLRHLRFAATGEGQSKNSVPVAEIEVISK